MKYTKAQLDDALMTILHNKSYVEHAGQYHYDERDIVVILGGGE